MKKGLLLTLLLATTSLFVACGSAPTQDNTDNTDAPATQSTQSSIDDVQEPVEEFISLEERNSPGYKTYFNLIGYLYGSQHEDVDDNYVFEAYEEYTTKDNHILINLTSVDGTKGAIRFKEDSNTKNWKFDNIVRADTGFLYLPNDVSEQPEEFAYFIHDISALDGNPLYIKDCTDADVLNSWLAWFPLASNFRYFEPSETPEYTLDIQDTYAKLIYRSDYTIPTGYDTNSGTLTYCAGYTCIYDDYVNQKRHMIVYADYNYSYASKKLDLLNSIEFLSDEQLPTDTHSYWTFPEGMEGYTAKMPFKNGMSRNITSYTTPDGHEMLFHWYGPSKLGTQAYESNGVLTLGEANGYYKLNAQAIPVSEITDKFDIESYGLMEHEHFYYGHIDDYGTQILYRIEDDNGYLGFATLLYGSDYAMPDDYVYFFTFLINEEVYVEDIALEVMASLDYHFEEDNR